MLLYIGTMYNDVIEIHLDEGQVTQDSVHYPLEGTWGVGQAHWKDQPFPLSILRNKYCLVDTIWVHFKLPVSRTEVKACKYLQTRQCID